MIIKKIILLLSLGMFVLSEDKKGFEHYCRKGTECTGLTPAAYGCLTIPYGASKCFYYNKLEDGKKTKSRFLKSPPNSARRQGKSIT